MIHRRFVLRPALWALAFASLAALLITPRASEAKLDPYYVLRGRSFGQIKPRVLIVLDTSGSMGYLPSLPDRACGWEGCDEANGSSESRISVARRAIREVVQQTQDSADYAVMTFGLLEPPADETQIPLPCREPGTNPDGSPITRRFTDVDNGYQWDPTYEWESIEPRGPWGQPGAWALCGDNRAYPYLRYDDVVFSAGGTHVTLANNQTTEPPDEPLYAQIGDQDGYRHINNRHRGVQFMPQFLGRRINLDCNNPAHRQIAEASQGDYGSNLDPAARLSAVCGQDFYYWPYVDGYSGMGYEGANHLYGETGGVQEYVCAGVGACSWRTTILPGAQGHSTAAGTLVAPFYVESLADHPTILAADRGPQTKEESNMMVGGVTGRQIHGGVEGYWLGTPMASLIGDPDTYANVDPGTGEITTTAAVPESNRPFTHDTVASYLSFVRGGLDEEICVPTSAIVVTDGVAYPWGTEGSTNLFSNLSKLRERLGVLTYVVGFGGSFSTPDSTRLLHDTACAAAGSNNTSAPCYGTPASSWDTCADPENPTQGCAYTASSSTTLVNALTGIIGTSTGTRVETGPGFSANESYAGATANSITRVQTEIEAYTEAPSWRGHLERKPCTHLALDEDGNEIPGQLAPACEAATNEPLVTLDEEDYGAGNGCGLSRVWDAGACLQARDWNSRKLYTHAANGDVFAINDGSGAATASFLTALSEETGVTVDQTRGNEIAAFLLGRDAPDGWKLPSISNSAPIKVSRVGRKSADPYAIPSVRVGSPHCSGRVLQDFEEDIPESLQEFSERAWNDDGEGLLQPAGGYTTRYEYAEAILIGDDFGILHAFHYDSGNEIFGFIPRDLLAHVSEIVDNGAETFGQPVGVEEHEYGIASTVNTYYVYDERTDEWRHLAIFGFGKGGNELVALDVSHMGRIHSDDPDDPVEVLWTSETVEESLRTEFDVTLGETWSRPAIALRHSGGLSTEPKAYVVFNSGYSDDPASPIKGRTAWVIDALTGEVPTDAPAASFRVTVPPSDHATYDAADDWALPVDMAVGSHCISRYWAEMEETYFADPAGRLFRWDLGQQVSGSVGPFPHLADSGAQWAADGASVGTANQAAYFPACQGTGDSCTVGDAGGDGVKGDVFTYSPAVMTGNRVDPYDRAAPLGERDKNQFLVAMVSGSLFDDAVDGGQTDNDFHSSIYLLVDDHRPSEDEPDPAAETPGGFQIPEGAPLGVDNQYMRMALSSIERTRNFTFANGETASNTRNFSKRARPIRSPLITAGALHDENGRPLDYEAFFITYFIYEPGDASCDPRWFDADTQEWAIDEGSTYEVRFSVVNFHNERFDFRNNIQDPSGVLGETQLLGPFVTQVSTGECDDGVCAPRIGTTSLRPCDAQLPADAENNLRTVQTAWAELEGFSPYEVERPDSSP